MKAQRRNVAWFLVPVLVILGIAGAAGRSNGEAKKEKEIPAAKEVGTQAEAIREARKVDLPLLEMADKVVIKATDGSGRVATLVKANDVKEVRQTLKISAAPPSAGEQAATVSFFRGKSSLRQVWVYEGGEWGFDRPGTHWTTGSEANLWTVIQKHLK